MTQAIKRIIERLHEGRISQSKASYELNDLCPELKLEESDLGGVYVSSTAYTYHLLESGELLERRKAR